MRSTANPLVFNKLELILQRLLDSVNHGYTHVVSGQVAPSKALRLASKFEINYQIFADKNLRSRRKRNGLGNAKWLCYIENDKLFSWLMVTPITAGNHFAHASENLVDVTKAGNRLTFKEFELVELPYAKLTKPKDYYKERAKPSRLTWRLTEESYQDMRSRIIDDVRSGDLYKLFSIIRHLYSLPGFGEIRRQVGKLVALYMAEVKRAGISNAPQPHKTLRYTRRLADQGIRMSVLVEAYKSKLGEV